MERKELFGLPLWLALAGLGAAGVVGYLLFFRNSSSSSSSGGGTTGYSSQGLAVMQNPDESATMALQNQELSLIGNQLTAQGTTLGNALNQGFGDVESGLSGDTTALQQQMGGLAQQGTDTQGLLAQLQAALASDTAGLQQGQSTLGGQLSSLQNTTSGSAAANSAYYNSLLANIVNYANSLSSQVAGVGGQVQGVSNQVSGVSGQVGQVQGGEQYSIQEMQTYFPALVGLLNQQKQQG